MDLPEATSLFAVLALEGSLERILKVHVELAPVTSLKPRVRAEAPRDPECLQDSLDAIVAIKSQVAHGDLSDGLIFEAVRVGLIEIEEAIKAVSPEGEENSTTASSRRT